MSIVKKAPDFIEKFDKKEEKKRFDWVKNLQKSGYTHYLNLNTKSGRIEIGEMEASFRIMAACVFIKENTDDTAACLKNLLSEEINNEFYVYENRKYYSNGMGYGRGVYVATLNHQEFKEWVSIHNFGATVLRPITKLIGE